MATTASIKVIKQFTYRRVTREFSNRYHFNGGTPSDNTHWTTLSDAVVTAEKAIYLPFGSTGAKIIETVGYDSGSEVPVFSKLYSTDGTLTMTDYSPTAGDVAALVRYATADRSSKNHPIYLFNYYHGMHSKTSVDADTISSGEATALGTYADAWITGFSDGTVTHKRCRPQSTSVATGRLVEGFLTHRDLPR